MENIKLKKYPRALDSIGINKHTTSDLSTSKNDVSILIK